MPQNNHDQKIIDVDFLKKVIGKDEQFKKELFEIFIENSQANIKKLENALNKKDSNSWYMICHALRGASSSIGAFRLSNLFDLSQKSEEFDETENAETLRKVKEEFKLVIDQINIL